MRNPRLILLIAVVSTAILTPAGPSTAQDVDVDELASRKAALVYKFTRFVRWPKRCFGAETDPFIIVVPGDADFAEVLRGTTEGRETGGRSIRIIQPGKDANVGLILARCHLLYISAKGADAAARYLAAAREKPILTVSDAPGFAPRHGMIGLVRHDRTVQFEINQGRARARGLEVHSNLLSLATVVESEASEP